MPLEIKYKIVGDPTGTEHKLSLEGAAKVDASPGWFNGMVGGTPFAPAQIKIQNDGNILNLSKNFSLLLENDPIIEIISDVNINGEILPKSEYRLTALDNNLLFIHSSNKGRESRIITPPLDSTANLTLKSNTAGDRYANIINIEGMLRKNIGGNLKSILEKTWPDFFRPWARIITSHIEILANQFAADINSPDCTEKLNSEKLNSINSLYNKSSSKLFNPSLREIVEAHNKDDAQKTLNALEKLQTKYPQTKKLNSQTQADLTKLISYIQLQAQLDLASSLSKKINDINCPYHDKLLVHDGALAQAIEKAKTVRDDAFNANQTNAIATISKELNSSIDKVEALYSHAQSRHEMDFTLLTQPGEDERIVTKARQLEEKKPQTEDAFKDALEKGNQQELTKLNEQVEKPYESLVKLQTFNETLQSFNLKLALQPLNDVINNSLGKPYNQALVKLYLRIAQDLEAFKQEVQKQLDSKEPNSTVAEKLYEVLEKKLISPTAWLNNIIDTGKKLLACEAAGSPEYHQGIKKHEALLGKMIEAVTNHGPQHASEATDELIKSVIPSISADLAAALSVPKPADPVFADAGANLLLIHTAHNKDIPALIEKQTALLNKAQAIIKNKKVSQGELEEWSTISAQLKTNAETLSRVIINLKNEIKKWKALYNKIDPAALVPASCPSQPDCADAIAFYNAEITKLEKLLMADGLLETAREATALNKEDLTVTNYRSQTYISPRPKDSGATSGTTIGASIPPSVEPHEQDLENVALSSTAHGLMKELHVIPHVAQSNPHNLAFVEGKNSKNFYILDTHITAKDAKSNIDISKKWYHFLKSPEKKSSQDLISDTIQGTFEAYLRWGCNSNKPFYISSDSLVSIFAASAILRKLGVDDSNIRISYTGTIPHLRKITNWLAPSKTAAPAPAGTPVITTLKEEVTKEIVERKPNTSTMFSSPKATGFKDIAAAETCIDNARNSIIDQFKLNNPHVSLNIKEDIDGWKVPSALGA